MPEGARILKPIAVALLLLSAAACTTRTVYYREGATSQDLSQDATACDEGVPTLADGLGTGFNGAANLRRSFDQCMAGLVQELGAGDRQAAAPNPRSPALLAAGIRGLDLSPATRSATSRISAP